MSGWRPLIVGEQAYMPVQNGALFVLVDMIVCLFTGIQEKFLRRTVHHHLKFRFKKSFWSKIAPNEPIHWRLYLRVCLS